MDSLKIKRNGRDMIYIKDRRHFAVKLKAGRARDEKALEACCGAPQPQIRHVEDTHQSKMDIFSVEDAGALESTMQTIRQAPASSVVTHVYSVDDTPGGMVIPTGTMTVQFKPNVGLSDREKVFEEFGLEILEDLDFLPGGYTVRLTSESRENPLKIAAKLQKRKEIESAEPDLSYRRSLKHVPTDTLYPQQWHLHNRGGQAGLTEGADVKAEKAWDITRGSRDITVCVIDDGFDLEHPDFKIPGKIRAPMDFTDSDDSPFPGTEDDNHGTACAGVAIAEETGTGVVGLAPGCAFMPVRMSTWLSDENIRRMFQHAFDQGADVISCSWSAEAWDFPLSTKVAGIIRKVATQGRKNGKGCVILFAAGNENRPLDGIKDGKTSHQGFAIHADVIAVGASNSRDERSTYSNYGPQLAFCAPSSGSPGRQIVTTDRRNGEGYSPSDFATDFGGTSSATPLAAGLAALVLSAKPDLSSAEVKRIMMASADKIQPATGKYVDGHSEKYGHGRINAHQALLLATGLGSAGSGNESLLVEHQINKSIQDMRKVEDRITFPWNAEIREFEVSLSIRHGWRGDLRVSLRSPQGKVVVLHDRAGGDQDDLRRSFRTADDPALGLALRGAQAKGDWHLWVEDLSEQDEGVLEKWGISVTYAGGGVH